jgi:catechol 2,3-dioxygenase-like lactoylglutathione lyase family enzyme
MSTFYQPQVILFSDDVARVAAFYEKLGFTETFRVPTEGKPIHIDLVLDAYKLGFSSAESTRDDHGLDPVTEGQHTAVILWTDDTAAAYEHVISLGAPEIEGPHVWLDRLLIAWTADPDGNPIQIVQSLAE